MYRFDAHVLGGTCECDTAVLGGKCDTAAFAESAVQNWSYLVLQASNIIYMYLG